MNLQRTTQGFTLIELLVVITIIGILSTVTLVSFGGVTSSAQDARDEIHFKGLHIEGARYYQENSFGYNGFCGANEEIHDNLQGGAESHCDDGDLGWAAYFHLRGSDDRSYCVDSSLAARIINRNLGTGDLGDADEPKCPSS